MRLKSEINLESGSASQSFREPLPRERAPVAAPVHFSDTDILSSGSRAIANRTAHKAAGPPSIDTIRAPGGRAGVRASDALQRDLGLGGGDEDNDTATKACKEIQRVN